MSARENGAESYATDVFTAPTVSIDLQEGNGQMYRNPIQAYVDDTRATAETRLGLERSANAFLVVFSMMGIVCNPKKTVFSAPVEHQKCAPLKLYMLSGSGQMSLHVVPPTASDREVRTLGAF